jgi:hypothetical protein
VTSSATRGLGPYLSRDSEPPTYPCSGVMEKASQFAAGLDLLLDDPQRHCLALAQFGTVAARKLAEREFPAQDILVAASAISGPKAKGLVTFIVEELGADVNGHVTPAYAGEQNSFALLQAVDHNAFDTVQELLQKGANVNHHAPVTGITALWHASHHGNLAMVYLLCENGAGVKVRKKQTNSTPLIGLAPLL